MYEINTYTTNGGETKHEILFNGESIDLSNKGQLEIVVDALNTWMKKGPLPK